MNNTDSSKALKAGLWYTISNFLSKGLVFLTTPIFARVLTKTEYGMYSNYATWQSLLLIIATFELFSTIPRARYDFPHEMEQYTSTITILGSGITLCFYIIAIITMPTISSFLEIAPKYIHIMYLYILVAPALQTYQAKCRIFLQYKPATVITIISSIASILVAILLVFKLDDKLLGRIVGQQLVLIVVNVGVYIYIVFRGKGFYKKFCRYALTIAIPLIPHIIAGNLLGSFDKIAIQKICGPEDLAYYSLAFSCALLGTVLWSSLNQAMVTWLFQKLSNANYPVIRRVSRYYLGAFISIMIGIMLFVPEIILIIGGESFRDAKYVMIPIILGTCFQFTYSMYVNIEMYQKKTLLISIGTVCAALINIPLNYIFVSRYGYIAAAYTTMFCYALLAVFHYIIISKIGYNSVYDNKFNATILLSTMVIAYAINLTYVNSYYRFCLVFLYFASIIVVGIKNAEAIKKIVHMIVK